MRIEKSTESGAIGILLERYSHLIVIVCLKYLEREADASLAARKVLHQLNIDLQNHRVKSLNSRVYALIRQYCRAPQTSAQAGVLSEDEEGNAEVDPGELLNPATLTSTEKARLIGRLEKAFNFLEREEQDCIAQFYIQGKSFEEIAGQKQIPAAMIRKHIREGKRKIQSALMGGNA